MSQVIDFNSALESLQCWCLAAEECSECGMLLCVTHKSNIGRGRTDCAGCGKNALVIPLCYEDTGELVLHTLEEANAKAREITAEARRPHLRLA